MHDISSKIFLLAIPLRPVQVDFWYFGSFFAQKSLSGAEKTLQNSRSEGQCLHRKKQNVDFRAQSIRGVQTSEWLQKWLPV